MLRTLTRWGKGMQREGEGSQGVADTCRVGFAMRNDETNPAPVPGATGEGESIETLTQDAKTANLLRRVANDNRRRPGTWPITDRLLQKGVETADGLMDDPDPRNRASGLKCLTAMQGQNQADEHLAEKHKRLDEGKGTDGTQITVVHVERPVAGNEVP